MESIDKDFKFRLEVDENCIQSIIPGSTGLPLHFFLMLFLIGAKSVGLFKRAAIASGPAVRAVESGKLRPILQIDFCHNKVVILCLISI